MDRWYRCSLSCEQRAISIEIFDEDDSIFSRTWNIPQGHVFVVRPEDRIPIGPPIPVVLYSGTIGFRNDGQEQALVKNVLIERLR